ncbi:MAG TPA: tripartite tricarboxylate transporter TctB family protein [Dongiaceae bacterium]|nr:tripartite tricarboxylate transporter TctB family protein [Dongiaceae bacterium]
MILSRDSLVAIVIFVFSLTAFIMAGSYSGGAEIFPRGISAIMMICSVILFIRGMVRPTVGEPMKRDEIIRVGSIIVATLIYIVAVNYLGFVLSSIIFVPVIAYRLGIRNHALVWISTLIFVPLVAYLFRSVFHVPLPDEIFMSFF